MRLRKKRSSQVIFQLSKPSIFRRFVLLFVWHWGVWLDHWEVSVPMSSFASKKGEDVSAVSPEKDQLLKTSCLVFFITHIFHSYFLPHSPTLSSIYLTHNNFLAQQEKQTQRWPVIPQNGPKNLQLLAHAPCEFSTSASNVGSKKRGGDGWKLIFNTNSGYLKKKASNQNPTIYMNGVKPGSLKKRWDRWYIYLIT